MSKTNYENFDLEFYKTGELYKVKARSFAGEATHTLTLPFSSELAKEFVMSLERGVALNTVKSELVKAWGGSLYEAVFTNDIRAIYKSSLDLISAKGRFGLRIRLYLQDVLELSYLPWEYLFQAATNQFLCHNRQTPIVRYFEIPKVISPLTIKSPLRVLFVLSNPVDLAPLELEHEKAQIQTALVGLVKRQLVEMICLKVATIAELQKTLRHSKFHVFHFIGHGDFDETINQGVLAFEREDKTVAYLKAEQLAAILGNHSPLRLAVLNSCKGACASHISPFAGTAATLIQCGIPAVTAMQFPISDTAAIKFAGEFYAAVADGLPIDMAITEARVRMFSEEDSLEWGTPALFMRSPDGCLFEFEKEAPDESFELDKPPDGGGQNAQKVDQKSSRHKLKRKKFRRVPLAIYTFVTLFFGAITFIILAVLPQSTNIEMEVFAKQVNFTLAPEIRNGHEVSLLHSGLWAKKVSITEIRAIELLVVSPPFSGAGRILVNPITIYPELNNSRVLFYSPLSDILLQEVICDSGSHVSITRNNNGIVFQIQQSSRPPRLDLSVGENVRIMAQACKVTKGSERELTSLFTDGIVVRLHEMSRSLTITGQNDVLNVVADSLDSQEDGRIEFVLKRLVSNLDFLEDIYQYDRKTTRSTIDSISIKKSLFIDDTNFKARDVGDLAITVEPHEFAIDELSEYKDMLRVKVKGQLKKLQVGEKKIVHKYLSLIAHNPVISVTMTWVGWFLTMVLPVLLKSKFGHKNNVD